jgi:hypothetical protein
MMTSFKKLSVLLCLVLAVPAITHAAESPLNEVEGGSSSALGFGTGNSTAFSINVGYSRLVLPEFLEIGTNSGFSTSGGTSFLALRVGPTFDLPIDSTGIRNAVYLRALGGISYTNSGAGSTNFAYEFQIGKRFEILHDILWKPAFDMSGIAATGANPYFMLIPVQFAFAF